MPPTISWVRILRAFLPLAIGPAGGLPAAEPSGPEMPMSPPRSSVVSINYHGWPDAILLSNGLVEAVIVPTIGRVMQFRFAGSQDGPFWENPGLWGRRPNPGSEDWSNFGGDKAWPAPQAAWRRLALRDWPPPRSFDGAPMKAAIDGLTVTLISPEGPGFGMRVRRRIELAPDRPVMLITTSFDKITGSPLEAGVWVITQLKDPVAVYALLPDSAAPDAGYVRQSADLPTKLKRDNELLSLTRDPLKNHKIGTLAGTLVWIGPSEMVRIDSALVPGGKYPDDGSSAEVYTNADPLPYVELELLGPLTRLAAGERMERLSSYILVRRTDPEPESDLRRLLAGEPGTTQWTAQRTL
jgi:hypothetical protein